MEQSKQARMAMVADKVEVGSIFVAQWGYEQTNTDFFQVISKSKSFCVIKNINYEYIHCDKVKPVNDSFRDYAIWDKKTNEKGKRCKILDAYLKEPMPRIKITDDNYISAVLVDPDAVYHNDTAFR